VPNFSSVDWSGTLKEYPLTSTGGRGTEDWDAAQGLLHRTDRYVVTSAGPGEGKGVQFLYTSLTASQKQIMDSGDGSGTPESSDGKGTNRVDWVRGIQTDEGSLLRTRSSVLGAVVNAQPVYVAYPSSGYRDYFPPNPGTPGTPSPETAAYSGSTPDPTKSYSGFVAANLKRMPTLYVAANDGMLHAFDAQSKAQSPTAGSELWAYVPDAAYRKLWFFSQKDNFKYRPTVDATPIYRDVYFSSSSKSTVGWHTILVGGLRYGGRGIYALDITSSGTTNAAGAAGKVLWEFNANSLDGTTKVGANLGYTFGQPNIGRLSNGKWVVLVPAGYFPTDSTDPEYGAAAASATNSSLFILDAQTGALIKELKTPTSYGGVTITSYGLSSPVLGDYDNDQIDDVAFAGDLVGNLWRFNLKDLNTVDLVFSPKVSAAQPITVMPRLFPDPTSQNFIVVFGTGKFIGDDDRTSTGAVTQSVYGIRDLGQTNKTGLPWTVDKLVAQTLNQTSAGLRGLTSNPAPTTSKPGGWYFDLVSAGEKVVVTPTALFNTNQAIITTLIPTTPDPCNPGRAGALMVIDSSTGGAGAGVSGGSYTSGSQKFTVAGAKVDNPPATGGLPAATGLGGGSVIVPGVTVTGSGAAFSVGSPIWRRRSWRILNDQ
jgi:type IV pilus assembly protein PilY1